MSEGSNIEVQKFIVESKLDPKHKQHGWLSPEGAFVTCNFDQHDACAKFIVKLNTDFFKTKIGEDFNELEPRTILGKSGYIKIAGEYPDFYNIGGNITAEQYKLLRKAGFNLPQNINLDPTDLLPKKEDVLMELADNKSKAEISKYLDEFYNDPFNGFRTTNLELGNRIFDLLNSHSSKVNEIESSEPNGIVHIVWENMGDGRLAIAKELYHHAGESPKDYGAEWENITVYMNTPEYIKNRIPQESQR